MINLDNLNKQQREAVTTTEGPVLVVAGAGSGKTMVLTYRIAYLLSLGIPPNHILALTFTNKAASEMKERIRKLIGTRADYLFMGTFHSIFARFLRAEANKLGYTSDYSIYDTEDSERVIKNILKDLNISENQFSPRMIQYLISKAKNSLLHLNGGIDHFFQKYNRKLKDVYEEYLIRLKNSNAMDFDDLLIKPIELFIQDKETLEKYRNRFEYILVDEYQDTNSAQYYLLKLLVNEKRNICVVGDDAQSIYKWRGAEIKNIIDFHKEFNETKIIRLEQNYRSTKAILSVADSVIKKNVYQIEKTLWTANEIGDNVEIIECFDEKDEANYVVNKIANIIQSGKYLPGEIAILYRINSQSRNFEETLIKSSIPYIIVGGVEFYKRKEVKDVLAYLRLLINPKDDESFLRIVNFPARNIGEVSIDKLKQFSLPTEYSLFESIPLFIESSNVNERMKKNFKSFYDFIRKYQDLVDKIDINELVRNYIDETGILQALKEENTDEAEARFENVMQLINALKEFTQQNPEKTLRDFLTEVSLISDIDTWEERDNSVVLMTLHAAKGLEFKVVFLVGCEEGLLPLQRVGEIEDLEEERRLFYVGCTRAMKNLFITYAKNRFRYNMSLPQVKSRFVTEIDSEYVTYKLTQAAELLGSRKNNYQEIITDEYSQLETYSHLKNTSSTQQLRIGSIVQHDVFGKGKVVYCSGSGDNQKVIVEFTGGIKKHLLVKFAKLKLLKK